MTHHPDNTLEAAANKLLDATGEPGTRLVERLPWNVTGTGIGSYTLCSVCPDRP